jgi:6-phosphogluconolactonase
MSGQVKPNIEVFSEAPALAQAAADLFVETARKALETRGRFMVAISGGRTPKLLFDCLTSDASALPWSQCFFFWVDERYVPVTDAASNFKMANEALLEPLGVPKANIHRMPTELPLDQAVAQYEATLQSRFSVKAGEVPQFDLIQLGMGPDGHTASLFPNSYESDTKQLVAWTVPPEAPHHRVTLTPCVLRAASQIMILLTGKDKASMLKTVFSNDPNVMQYPIHTVWPVLDRVSWLLDQDAASKL